MKNDHIKLYLMSAITMGAIFVAIAGAAFSAPATDPPAGTVTPTFSGLNVRGTIQNNSFVHCPGGICPKTPIKINDDMEVSGDIASGNADPLRITDNMTVEGDLDTSGTITSDTGIGSYYSNIKVVRITNANTGAFEVCDSGDTMIGCEAYFDADSTSDIFKGSYIGDVLGNPGTEEICWGVGEDNAGANDYMYVTTHCFDSQGNKSGRDVYNPYF